jgi:hypothetical protein
LAEPPRILIPGGYGVFGRLIARELLARTPARLVIAGRNLGAAMRACRNLGGVARCEPLALDLADSEAFARAVSGCFAVVCAAGPFQRLDPSLAEIATRADAHWLDISDETNWVVALLEKGRADSGRSATVILPGLSTTPALSGVLVRWLKARLPDAQNARITLFIGNRNRKGAGAIASALESELDWPLSVDLPVGRIVSYRFRSPDRELLGRELGIEAEFRVAFEWRIVRNLLVGVRAMSRIAPRTARLLSAASEPFRFFGSEMGCIQVRLATPDGRWADAWFLARGQRLAALPAAIATEALLAGEATARASVSPAELFTPEEWIELLGARGVDFGARVSGEGQGFPT